MKYYRNFLAIFLLTIAITISCTNEKKEKTLNEDQAQQTINPNVDSELSILMRNMFDEAKAIKKQVKNGEQITVKLNHEEILTAHATDPDEAASPEYKAFANLYLQSLKNLKSAKSDELVNFYSVMVENCMACHKVFCPGPLDRIRKLK